MEEVKRMGLAHRRQLEDVPELIHYIQALLPPKDAARTCVLSKSWLHAWSTVPTLRFCQSSKCLTKQQETRYLKLIRRTIRRYYRDNIPIITCDIHFGIRKPKSATRAEKFIKRVASKSSLKKLLLTVVDDIASFTLPDEIFSSENLNTLSIKLDFSLHMECPLKKNYPLHISSNPLIVCVNLRVLELLDVHISHEEVLHNLLSTCKLLEKINLRLLEGLDKIKVNKLLHLQELKIAPGSETLEINDVPRLCSLIYETTRILDTPVLSIADSIGSMRKLCLKGLTLDDDGLCNIISTKFPFLKSLTLEINRCRVEILDIRSNSLQRLFIQLSQFRPIEIQVNAPKLLSFRYKSFAMPSLRFPTIVPAQIELTLVVNRPIDDLFFIKLRECLNLSSKFNIVIRSFESAVLEPFSIDDVRLRVLFPATNVKKLSFETFSDDGLVENSVYLFDALFSICQPLYVEAHLQMRLKAADYFLELTDMGVTENKSGNWLDLKRCEIRNGLKGEWETLTSSSLSLVGEWSRCVFKLTHCSP
ncbi:F-box protein-like protein [Tanacetum coccineum]